MASRSKRLRSGYTTGACAAAAAKAAAMLLIRAEQQSSRTAEQQFKMKEHPTALLRYCATAPIEEVEIPFPDGSRVKFKIQDSRFKIQDGHLTVTASVIKDAGDDPDVTNGAEIVAEVKLIEQQNSRTAEQQNHKTTALLRYCATGLAIKGGKGVGVVTKPGLSVSVGEPAINPVPKKMIKEAVMEALNETNPPLPPFAKGGMGGITITISVTDGESLAKKTLNQRLGIIGGISILGTTGIVKPISAEAWTATITSSMDVAKAMGQNEIALSAGRASELAHIKKYNLPEECYVMMGDYLEFSLLEAKKHAFKKIHLCAQWAKMLKIAMATPQTHVRHGAIDLKKALEFLKGLVAGDWGLVQDFNTAMEIFEFISASRITHHASLFLKACVAAKKYAESISSGIPVISYLVSYEGEIIASSE